MHVKTWKQEGHPWIIDADVVTIKNVKTVEKEKLQGHSWPIDVVDLTTGKLKTENRMKLINVVVVTNGSHAG